MNINSFKTMKTLFNGRIIRVLFVGLLTICFPINVLSASVKTGFCGDSVEWSLSGGVLTISGSGQMQNFHKGKRPWRGTIKSVIIEEGVTSIGSRAFEYYSRLREISIPSSVKTIGDSAFVNCVSLKKIVIPNSVTSIGKTCFARCYNLSSISLSSNLQFIGEKAFDRCESMTDIIIPNSVQSIGRKAFADCYKLTILIVPDEPFEIVGKDSVLGLLTSKQLSMVRGNHTLCPDYMLKYIPKDCPFMQEGNPRRYYTGSISKDSVVIIPAIKTFTLQEAMDTVECIINKHFSLANPCLSFLETEEYLSKFIINLERPVYQELLQHYYDAFYEAGSNNELDAATALAFKHVMLGGKEDEELMWDIILTKYGFENATNNLRFLMKMFNEISIAKDSVYQNTIDSITSVYYDVMYPNTLRSMQGYWVSLNDPMTDGSLAPIPDYIINIADITNPKGTTILSAPKCNWYTRKKKGLWLSQIYGNWPFRYSYETGYNEETQTVQILFSSQSKKIANTKLQHQALDMVQNLEATMYASLEQYQDELNRQLAANVLSFSDWGAKTAAGFGINVGVRLAAAVLIYAIVYTSNIETAETYNIQLTPLVPQVLDVSVKYGYARHNYNNGKTQHKEDIKKLTFVKWEETDSVVFISKRLQPIFCGDTLSVNSPLLERFNAKKDKTTCQEINQTAMNKLRQKAERLLRLKEEEESVLVESSDNEEDGEEEIFFY